MSSDYRDILSRTAAQDLKASFDKDVDEDDEELEKVLASLNPVIKIIGCGGGGSNTVHRIVESGLTNVEIYAANTDAQHLLMINAPHKILLGRRKLKGLGAGAIPKTGEDATFEALDDIKKAVQGANMVFTTCGLGGGTGTGSIPIVSKVAKESGALTIAFVTLPFKYEGFTRMENARWGLEKLLSSADTVVVIPNDKLLSIAGKVPLNMAFKISDEVLMNCIKGMIELLTKPGLVNLDFNDMKTIMTNGGIAMVGIGESSGDDRAYEATMIALNSPLLDVDISHAKGALVNVTGGPFMTVSDAERVVEEVHKRISPDAKIIWGASVEANMDRTIRVMIIITGGTIKEVMRPAVDEKTTKAGIDRVSPEKKTGISTQVSTLQSRPPPVPQKPSGPVSSSQQVKKTGFFSK